MDYKEELLFFEDLCGRIPYGLYVSANNKKGVLLGTIGYKSSVIVGFDVDIKGVYTRLEDIKPYLRKLSSMTDEEKSELQLMGFRYENGYIINEDANIESKCSDIIRFLNSKHLDYRGMIDKDLALEATEDMYN